MSHLLFLLTLLIPTATIAFTIWVGVLALKEMETPKAATLSILLPIAMLSWLLLGYRQMTMAWFYPNDLQTARWILVLTLTPGVFLMLYALRQMAQVYWLRRAASLALVGWLTSFALFLVEMSKYWNTAEVAFD